MSNHREALDRILILCNQSHMYTRRTQAIHEIAMQGLGLTENQRQERHLAVMRRNGGDTAADAFLERRAKRAAKLAEKYGEDMP